MPVSHESWSFLIVAQVRRGHQWKSVVEQIKIGAGLEGAAVERCIARRPRPLRIRSMACFHWWPNRTLVAPAHRLTRRDEAGSILLVGRFGGAHALRQQRKQLRAGLAIVAECGAEVIDRDHQGAGRLQGGDSR